MYGNPVAAVYSFRGYMEQIIFGSSSLLKPTTYFWKTFPTHSIFLRTAYLFIHSVLCFVFFYFVSVFVFMTVIHSLKCTVSFSFIVPLAVVCCHLLSFAVTCCHSLSLAVILCHSLNTRCHSLYHSSVFFKRIFI